jgi:alanyl-tRNA synthetase
VTSSSSTGLLRVLDTQKAAGGGALFMHWAVVEAGTVTVGASASAKVDVAKRRRAQCHHTATHLLQAALRKVVGQDVSQAGSLVAFDRLRFDINCPRPVTEEELARVEELVNGWILDAVPLEVRRQVLTSRDR